jgi:hypothetical protein
MDKPTECFVGKKSCGCVVWLCAVNEDPAWTAEQILEARDAGLTIERMPTEQAKQAFCRDCPHEHPTLELEESA